MRLDWDDLVEGGAGGLGGGVALTEVWAVVHVWKEKKIVRN